MRLELKRCGADLYSVAAARWFNDPTVSVGAKTCSETNRHIQQRDDLVTKYSTIHANALQIITSLNDVTNVVSML